MSRNPIRKRPREQQKWILPWLLTWSRCFPRGSMPCLVYRSILALLYRPIVDLDGHLGCVLQISPKCSKIITYLQNIPDLINIINRLYNNIIISKNTYKLWMKMGQIHNISEDHYFCKNFPYTLAGDAIHWFKKLPP